MIFQFPNLESLRLAITSGQVPAEVSVAPVEYSLGDDGQFAVKMSGGMPPRAMQNALKKLGVKVAKEHFAAGIEYVDCWPQLLPVSKMHGMPEVTANTAVLFELPANEMPNVVMEMLRLGNDRQSFRVLAPTAGKGERVLLKVIGPPYYTLLRAIDRAASSNIVAYTERATGVWVELGCEHPLAAQIKPPKNQIRLLRPDRDWTAIEDGPFQDVYEVLDFKLPTQAVEWQEAQLKGKLAVPLRLVPGNAADQAEMWVLQDDAIDQLDALVRDADEKRMARLSFAVATEKGGPTTIVLKVRPSKLSPPVLTLDKAIGFKPYWKLPNLFLPVGTRLMPTLRRDAVRKLLADDPAQIVWLMPGKEGKFTPEMLPDDAFRPLEDWIDYVIDHEHEALQAWIQATQFDFESFLCRDEQTDKPKPPPTDKGRRDKRGDKDTVDVEATMPTPTKVVKKKQAYKPEDDDFVLPVEVGPPDELKLKRAELEQEFLNMPGALDDPKRLELWARLAEVSSAINDQAEAAICWMNSFWEEGDVPPQGAWAWLRTEHHNTKKVPLAEEFDKELKNPAPSPNEVRTMVARIVYACSLDTIPNIVVHRLPALRTYMEHNEEKLSVRAVWLGWTSLVRAGGPADILGLARVRDRMLQRLLREGLNKERDLPYFLRTAGAADSDRMRIVRDRAMKVHTLVTRWHSGDDNLKVNKPYVDLMFAFAMAKLGEVTVARDLIQSARASIAGTRDKPEPIHAVLLEAFVWRIENALQGKPHVGRLSPELLTKMEKLDEQRNNTESLSYVTDRLREQSWILEPQDKNDPYGRWKKHGNELQATLADLAKLNDPVRLEESLKKLLKSNPSTDNRLLIFDTAMMHAPRLSEEFAITLVQQVPPLLDAVSKISGTREQLAMYSNVQTKLLERALFTAGHYDRREQVQALFNRFLNFVQTRDDETKYPTINTIARECLRSLRKVGLKDEIDNFLKQITNVVTQGKSLAALKTSAGSKWSEVLIALLYLAEAWQYSGAYSQAKPYLEEARATIFANAKEKSIKPLQLTKLVQTYVSALGQGPVDEALNRIEELFQKLEKIPNGFTTSKYFSRLHLNIVEDVVRSLVSENFTMGDAARRWLEDDEYLVRRRIHGDMRYLLKQHGL